MHLSVAAGLVAVATIGAIWDAGLKMLAAIAGFDGSSADTPRHATAQDASVPPRLNQMMARGAAPSGL